MPTVTMCMYLNEKEYYDMYLPNKRYINHLMRNTVREYLGVPKKEFNSSKDRRSKEVVGEKHSEQTEVQEFDKNKKE